MTIVDCRSKMAAYGNGGRGGGVENCAHYSRTHLCFLGIANIHTMRHCTHQLSDLMQSTAAAGSSALMQYGT